MGLWLLLARLLLALVFGAAGVAKLADRESAHQTVINFGVPESLAKPLAFLLPVVEILTALALLPTQTAWWGALAALALLLPFTVGIGVNLARGNTPDCNCFGQLHSEPIGWRTIARNVALALVAAFILVQGRESADTNVVRWAGSLSAAEQSYFLFGAAALALLLAAVILLTRLLKQQSMLVRRLEELEERLADEGIAATVRADAVLPAQQLPIGAPAPGFSVSDLSGTTVTLGDLLNAGKPLLLFFVAPTCTPCAAMLPDLERWRRSHGERLTFTLVSKGTVEENRAKFAGRDTPAVLLQQDSEVSEAYFAKWTPGAVLVKPDGTVGSHIAYGSEEIKKLVRHATDPDRQQPWTSSVGTTPAQTSQGDEETARLKLGNTVPSVELTDLSGQAVELTDYLRGKKTLLFFWSPGCGFCKQMLEEVRVLEALPPDNRPQILLISTGTVEDNLNMNLQSPILLAEDFSTGKWFGASGTPSALLVDESGRIASTVGVGKVETLALAGFKAEELLGQRNSKQSA